jgi:hypothetical protein
MSIAIAIQIRQPVEMKYIEKYVIVEDTDR